MFPHRRRRSIAPIGAHCADISPPLRLPRRPLRMVHSAFPYHWNVEVHHVEPSVHRRPPIKRLRPPGKATPTTRLSPLPFLHRRSTAPITERTSPLGALAQGPHKSGVTRTYDAPKDAPNGASFGAATEPNRPGTFLVKRTGSLPDPSVPRVPALPFRRPVMDLFMRLFPHLSVARGRMGMLYRSRRVDCFTCPPSAYRLRGRAA